MGIVTHAVPEQEMLCVEAVVVSPVTWLNTEPLKTTHHHSPRSLSTTASASLQCPSTVAQTQLPLLPPLAVAPLAAPPRMAVVRLQIPLGRLINTGGPKDLLQEQTNNCKQIMIALRSLISDRYSFALAGLISRALTMMGEFLWLYDLITLGLTSTLQLRYVFAYTLGFFSIGLSTRLRCYHAGRTQQGTRQRRLDP